MSVDESQLRDWQDLEWEIVRGGVRRAVQQLPSFTYAMNEVAPDNDVRPHAHDECMQIAVIVSGRGIYNVDGVAYPVVAGSVLHIPPRTLHYIENNGEEVILNLDIFTPPRADLPESPVVTGRLSG